MFRVLLKFRVPKLCVFQRWGALQFLMSLCPLCCYVPVFYTGYKWPHNFHMLTDASCCRALLQIFIPDHNFHQPFVLPSIFEDRPDEHVGSHIQGDSGSAPTQKQKHPSYFEKNSQGSALPKGQKKREPQINYQEVPSLHSSVFHKKPLLAPPPPPPPLFSAPCSLIYTALMQSCAQSADETIISHINSFPSAVQSHTNQFHSTTYLLYFFHSSSIHPF